ncbi:AAA family ATPase [uncultured Sphingomonas sp.]|uniref:GumC family protein n=1 Tax=uncultured Sphingomonas sp. TaxID=158754 RepID=UPI0025CC5738|nr:AAA family ATPase [uncultured Sphingomonas sp.]
MNHHRAIIRAQGLRLPSGVSATAEPEAGDRLDLRALLTTLRRRLGLFLAVFALVVAGAAYLTSRQPTLYTAMAAIVLNLHQEQIAPKDTLGPVTSPADRADTEVEVLKSRNLADRVARSLKLAEDPSFNPALRSRPRGASWWRKLLGRDDAPPLPPSPEDVRREMIDLLQNALSVTRVGQTYAMEVAITTGSAINAARIANEYVRQYTQGQLQEKVDQGSVATTFLAGRLEELRAQAQADTARVQQYRIANNLLSTSGASLTEQEIASYSQAVSAARAQTSEDLARLKTAKDQMRQGSTGDDVGEALQSGVVSGLRARQAEVSGRLATLRSRYGPRHPEVLRASSELEDINRQIEAEIGRVISNLDARTHVSRERSHSISASLTQARAALAQSNAAMTGLDDLQRRAQASQSLYESYLNRYKEAVAEGGTERPDASVISRASIPLGPTSPRPKLNMLLGCVLGLGAGLVAAFLTEMLFSGLTTGNEVEQKFGLPYLGGIPLLSKENRAIHGADEAVINSPRSNFAEAFRSLLTSLYQVNEVPPKVMLVTSALPREGKTTISICLARTMARQGERTLLIDADYMQPVISRKLIPDAVGHGLLDVLNGDVALDQALVADGTPGMDILPVRDRPVDVGELMAGPPMQALLDDVRQRYDVIIIDAAPVLPIATSRVLAALADAVIFAVRWRHTPDHAVAAALRLLPARRVKIAGMVLSQIDMRKQVRVGHGDPSFYYRKYKSYYSW